MKMRFILVFAAISLIGFQAEARAQAKDAAGLSAEEERVVALVDARRDAAVALLERIVNVNSGTMNPAGVRRVYDVLAPELERLGFAVRYEALPDSMRRGGHLVAERRGNRGRKLLLIGHLDTVFEEDEAFQRFELVNDTVARGPGVSDMKGGDVVIVEALRALHGVGALDGTDITVVMTGDEEEPGLPLSAARAALLRAGEHADIALGFEGGGLDEQGRAQGVVARRSSTGWTLTVDARTAHSSGVFSDRVGAGAIYEAARILDSFYGELRGEDYLTFNTATIVGGTEATFDAATASGTVFGKSNVVPPKAIATGDIRTISNDQLERVRDRMRHVVAGSLPQTSASIVFDEGYPAMAPTPANYELLAMYDAASRDLGLGPVVAHDPARRGAADISFVADLVDAGIDGLGVYGDRSHTVEETVELPSLVFQAKRAALLIYRLTRAGAAN